MKKLFVLAWRNLWRNRRRTLITVSSVTFAVVLSIGWVAMAVGLREQAVETAVRNETGYLQIQDALYEDEPSLDHAFEHGEEVENALAHFEAEINFTVPRIRGFSLATGDVSTRGVMVSGILPEKEDRMSELSSRVSEGEMFAPDDQYAVIGRGLAELLDLSKGDEIILVGQGFQGVTAAGSYPVGGIIDLPMPEQNNTLVFLPLEAARWYFAAPDRLTHLVLMTDHDADLPKLAAGLREKLDEEWYAVLTWEQLMPDLLGLLQMRRTWNQLMAWVLYAIVGFGIFGTVLTMMTERLKEFGILLSVGMKRTQLAFVCFVETLLISLLGAGSGIMIGYPIMYYLNRRPLEFGGGMADYMFDLGMEPIIPFSIAPEIFLRQGFYIFCVAFLIGLYPVLKALKLDFVKAARG